MANGTNGITSLDMIHVALEQLGYVGEEFGANRVGPTLYGIYRRAGASLVVSWCNGCTVYEISATTAAAAETVNVELIRIGLMANAAGTRVNVHGQEHIDAEVRRMLAS